MSAVVSGPIDLYASNATETKTPPSGSRKYKALLRCHRTYDGELLSKMEDLYRGGWRMKKNGQKYLPRLTNEDTALHGERVATAGFQPYLGQVVNQFITDLFSQQLQLTSAAEAQDKADKKSNGSGTKALAANRAELPPFYTEFFANADMRGHPFQDVVLDATRTAEYKPPWGLVQIDAPAAKGTDGAPVPQSLAEEDSQGLRRLYCYELPPEQLINWKCDTLGGFVWAVVRQVEQDDEEPFQDKQYTTETWTLWRMDGGVAVWERYKARYETGKPPAQDADIPLDSADRTNFKRIPIIPIQFPDGLQPGDILGPMQEEHFQRRSVLIASMNKSLMAIPYVAMGDQVGRVGGPVMSDVAQDQSRGNDPRKQFQERGYMVLSKDDKVGYMEPDGACYDLAAKSVESVREAMLQVSHQMALAVKPTPGNAQRSGLSKQMDGTSTARVLGAMGHTVRVFATAVMDCIKDARGEDIHWQAHGLDTFEQDSDRGELVQEAISLPQILQSVKSITARKLIVFMLVKRLLAGQDPETFDTIEDELDAGMEAEEAMNLEATAAEHEAKVSTQELNKKQADAGVPPGTKPDGGGSPFGGK